LEEDLLCGRADVPCHPWRTCSREGFPEALQPAEELTLEQRKGVRRRE